MNKIKFFTEGLRNMRTVGTVTPSSRFLCESMLKGIDFSKAKFLVELGAGDGVVTKHILKRMRPDARLLAFEVQPDFCELLRAIPDPRLRVVEDSAEFLAKYLAEEGVQQVDHVISAIPFVIVPKPVAHRIVSSSRDALKPGGQFVQIHYSLIMKDFYKDIFPKVKVNFQALNLPPAFVFNCSE